MTVGEGEVARNSQVLAFGLRACGLPPTLAKPLVGKTVGVLLWMLRDVEASLRQALAGKVLLLGR